MFKNLIKINSLRYFFKQYRNNSTNVLNVLSKKDIGDEIIVHGWVKSLRNQKENVFLDINDGSTDEKLQIFVPQVLKPEGLTTGSSVKVSGIIKLSPKGQKELTAQNLEVIGTCVVSDGYPFAPRKKYTSEYIRQHLHFRPRTNKFSSVLRIRNAANLAIHNYYNSKDFINIHTPILTSNDCEGAGEVFKVLPESQEILKLMIKPGIKIDDAYFDRKVFLSVSGQLHLEIAAHGLSKVYSFGPTFRAENSRSRLHLSEFYMLEAEIAFLNNLNEIMEIVEDSLKSITKNILDKHEEDVLKCNEENTNDFSWLNKKFVTLSYDEAVNILKDNIGKYNEPFDEKGGFAKEHEIFLVDYCGQIPVFLIHFPKELKPFYMKELKEDPTKVCALDLLAPRTGEILGGSLREDSYEKLQEKIPKDGNLDWYLALRKFGGVPTGGFGLGFERYLQFLLGINNIKDIIPFPRWPHNCNL